jgi:ubiquinone/menaquinone biosynthesis C-methylase UbiE
MDQFETLQEMQRVLYRGGEAGEGEGSQGNIKRVDEFILENFDEECRE